MIKKLLGYVGQAEPNVGASRLGDSKLFNVSLTNFNQKRSPAKQEEKVESTHVQLQVDHRDQIHTSSQALFNEYKIANVPFFSSSFPIYQPPSLFWLFYFLFFFLK